MKEQDFIQKICGYAISDMKENGVLASVTIAQAILESSWGTSELAENANNYFGMKCSLSSNSWGSVWDRVSHGFAVKALGLVDVRQTHADHGDFCLFCGFSGFAQTCLLYTSRCV